MRHRTLSAILLAALMLASSLASAEVKNFEGTGEYIMSELETTEIAKQRAKARAEESCVEQAGSFVKNHARKVLPAVPDVEAAVIASGVLDVIRDEYTIAPVGESDGRVRIVAKIRASIDSKRIDSWLEQNRSERRELLEQNKRLQERKAKDDAEISSLQDKAAIAISEQEKERIKSEIADAERNFLTDRKVVVGWRLCWNEKYTDSAEVFSQAVDVDRENGDAYFGRGFVCMMVTEQKDYERAVADFCKSIELNPQNMMAHLLRGIAYSEQENYEQGIPDLSKVINYDPEWANAYGTRGICYFGLSDYLRASLDFTKAIDLDPRNAGYYTLRGMCYFSMERIPDARADFARAKSLN